MGAQHPGEVRFLSPGAQKVASAGGDPRVSRAIDPIAGGGNACSTTPAGDQPGTATYRLPKVTGRGYTLLGSPTVIADLNVNGAGAQNTQLAARLWDVAPGGSSQMLVARALYRPRGDGRQVFQLHPNGWHFAARHLAKLELLGNDDPYGRTSNDPFSITVSNLDFRLPVRERPASGPPVGAPASPFIPPRATPTPEAEKAVRKSCRKAKRHHRKHATSCRSAAKKHHRRR